MSRQHPDRLKLIRLLGLMLKNLEDAKKAVEAVERQGLTEYPSLEPIAPKGLSTRMEKAIAEGQAYQAELKGRGNDHGQAADTT